MERGPSGTVEAGRGVTTVSWSGNEGGGGKKKRPEGQRYSCAAKGRKQEVKQYTEAGGTGRALYWKGAERE